MMREFISRGIAYSVGLSLLFVACDSDNTGPGVPPADFSGAWDLVLEVSGKRLCDSEIDDRFNGHASIAQDGRNATMIIDPNRPIPLIVRGRKANGSISSGEEETEFELTVTAGELSGTLTYTDSRVPCTEIVTVSGTRDNAPPSSLFAGDWDLQTEVTESACSGVSTGEMETNCRRIRVENSTITIEDEDGPIRGVGDGDSATLFGITADERQTYRITLDGEEILGEIERYDLLEECSITQTIMGMRRAESCDESSTP